MTLQIRSNDLGMFKELANSAFKSGNYGGMSEATMLNIMLSAKDFGVSPLKALNGSFYIVNGKICMSTALMSDKIRKDGHSLKIIEMTREKCVIIGIRKDNGDSFKCEYTMEDAQLAGLVNSPTWKKFPKNMLYNRCMSMLARILFSDVIGNAYSEDEGHDIKNVPSEKRDYVPMEETIELKEIDIEDNDKRFDTIIELFLDEPEADKVKENFCKYYKLSNWMEANDLQIAQLEARLITRKQAREKVDVNGTA